MSDESSKKAHFVEPEDQDDLRAHDSKIIVEDIGLRDLNIRLGFLQIKHVYSVTFRIRDNLGDNVDFDPLENLNAKLESATPTEEGHEIVMTFNAAQEKLMKETLTLKSQDQDKQISLTIQARVLGKGKGTPMLKEGIHCVRIESDDESDLVGEDI